MSRFQEESEKAKFLAPAVIEHLKHFHPTLSCWEFTSNSLNLLQRMQSKLVSSEYVGSHYCFCIRAYEALRDRDYVVWFDVPIIDIENREWWIGLYEFLETRFKEIEEASEGNDSAFIYHCSGE
jgi:hypothetical protein